MGTYCKNHVEEEFEKLSKISKTPVKRIPTKEGMCGHIGGCNTYDTELTELISEYTPSESDVEIAKAAETEKEALAEESEPVEAESSASTEESEVTS